MTQVLTDPQTAPGGTACALIEATDVPEQTRRGLPFAALLGAMVGIALLACSLQFLRDIDLYWHILAGRELAAGARPDNFGSDWSFAPEPLPWTSTQWLAELLLHAVHSLGGWAALAAFRVISLGIALAFLAHATLRGRPRALSGLPFVIAAAALSVASQERPQQFTLIGAAVLGGVLVSGLVQGRLPRWWALAIPTVLWANLHGGWVLVPVTLALIAAGRLLDHGVRDRAVHKSIGLAAVTVLAGCLTPSGISGVTAALRFTRAADLISEWQPTEPMTALGLLSMVMLALICLGWARTQGRVALSEVLAVLALLAFTWAAWRNLAPGMAMIAPLVAHRLTAAFPGVQAREPRWSVPLGISLAFLLGMLGLSTLVGRPHLPLETSPITLAGELDGLAPGQRVLNDYNTAGVILLFAPEGTKVAIDGRSDRYGAQYIESYVKMMSLGGDWEVLLDRLDPTSALLESDSALAHALVAERGWTEVSHDKNYVLLLKA